MKNQSAWDQLQTDIDNVNTNATPYQFEFNSEDMFNMLDDINTRTRNNLGRSAATARRDATNVATQSMASRGITGGSVLDDTMEKVVNPINSGLFDNLSTLDDKTASAKLGVMDNQNKLGFEADSSAKRIEMLRLQLKQGALTAEEKTRINDELLQLEKDNQPNWWDDVLGVLGIGGDVAGGAGGLISGLNSYGNGNDQDKRKAQISW